MTDTRRLLEIIDAFSERRVLVLGDIVADEYVLGRPARISREAPVLILHYADSFIRPGGATNTAYNLSSLGASTSIAGIIGRDERGQRLAEILRGCGMATDGLMIDESRPTSTKTRIVAKGTQEAQQQIVRLDRVESRELSQQLRDELVEYVRDQLATIDALVISDYENGVISPAVVDACLPQASSKGIVTTVDSHGDLFRFHGVTAATPNQPEAAATLGRALETEEQLDGAGAELVRGMDADGVLITRGSEGIALYQRDERPFKLPIALSNEFEVVDPTGAGDTVAAVFTLALVCGASMREAAYLGNVAGGQVVRKLGAAALSRQELAEAVRTTSIQLEI